MSDLVLPAFELDCRDWLVVSPSDVASPDGAATAPVLAALSTVLIADDVHEVTGQLCVVRSDDDGCTPAVPVAPGSVACEVVDGEPDRRRYIMRTPTVPALALVAEFAIPRHAAAELVRRVTALMASFRWQAA